ncbi:MAG: cation:proton antiporter [Patescibacteria group bacterium]
MDMFLQIALVLLIATGFSLLMQKIRQPLILGHILTGIVVGPTWLGFLHPEGAFELFAKLGITALLFIVGLSLSPKVVREVGKTAVIGGFAQIIFTAFFGFLLALYFGWSMVPAIYIALCLTFSSTIIVLKILQDKRDIGALYGRLATGTMLVQDLAATILLVVMAAIGGGLEGGISQALLLIVCKGILLAVGLVFFSRVILPSMTKLFASSQEFLLLFSVAWGVGVAVVFKLMGFSVEVGALVAGVSLATSPYHYEISAKMKILRDFFLVLFFVTLGASLSFAGIAQLAVPAIVLIFVRVDWQSVYLIFGIA